MNKNTVRLGEPWSATCTSAVDGEIHWYIALASYQSRFDITELLRHQKCGRRKCRRRIIQWQVPSQRTFVSRLEIDHLEFDDLGVYSCRILIPERGHPEISSLPYDGLWLNYSISYCEEHKRCWFDIGLSNRASILPLHYELDNFCRYGPTAFEKCVHKSHVTGSCGDHITDLFFVSRNKFLRYLCSSEVRVVLTGSPCTTSRGYDKMKELASNCSVQFDMKKGNNDQEKCSPTPTSSPIYTPSSTSTPSPTYTSSPNFTPSPTSTSSPISTPSPTSTSSPNSTPYPTSTPTPTSTPYPTSTSSPTSTPSPTPTPSPISVHSSRSMKHPHLYVPFILSKEPI
ncbi:myosin light chain kinase, smooth muscle [Elysia marginata]|uniref:Myosin light chain kinase, smooth muscle n=1 Tax=Elysia marginata TaxID=1093978 RepID=A0AAV4EI85_9GAST|nr:myosin light chain kinase, smooth muscle [Elysia marginata]